MIKFWNHLVSFHLNEFLFFFFNYAFKTRLKIGTDNIDQSNVIVFIPTY